MRSQRGEGGATQRDRDLGPRRAEQLIASREAARECELQFPLALAAMLQVLPQLGVRVRHDRPVPGAQHAHILAPQETLSFRSRLASPPPEGHEVLVRFFNRRDLAAGMQ